MSKSTRALSGAAKNSFIDGIIRSALGEDHAARERVLQELTAAIASLRIRIDTEKGRVPAGWATEALEQIGVEEAEPSYPAPPAQSAFDPYTPNVIVVLRMKGRDAALAALAVIGDERHLRLLAHEQQLGIPPEAKSLPNIRMAIVAAAERRVANRRAAGS